MKPGQQENIQKVVVAAMKIMYDQSMREFLKQGMTSEQPLPQKLAAEAVGLLKLLDDKLKGSVPRNTLAPAAVLLIAEIADFLRKSGLGAPSKEDTEAAIRLLRTLIPRAFGQQSAPAGGPPQQSAAQPAAPQQPGLIGG